MAVSSTGIFHFSPLHCHIFSYLLPVNCSLFIKKNYQSTAVHTCHSKKNLWNTSFNCSMYLQFASLRMILDNEDNNDDNVDDDDNYEHKDDDHDWRRHRWTHQDQHVVKRRKEGAQERGRRRAEEECIRTQR